MRVEVDLAGRPVVVCGTAAGARRVLRRYAAGGAVVTAAVAGDLPEVAAQLPGVRYERLPAENDIAGWVNLLGSAWLAVAVGPEAARNDRLAGVCGHLRVLLTSEPAARHSGEVTLVGGGPGTSRLLTVEACDALREADVVFYDRLAPPDDLAALAPGAELVDVGKRPYHHPVTQADIEQQMVERAVAGESVVRLKGGDPFVFGRGGEELIACARAGVEVRVVPGVTSAISVPGAAGIPLTHRGVSRAFTVISGHDPLTPEQTRALAELDSTIVILMGMNNLHQITAGLLRSGLAPHTPAAVVERGFTDRQRTVVAPVSSLLEAVRSAGLSSPAVVVLGAVVAVAGQHSFGSSQTADPDSGALLGVEPVPAPVSAVWGP
jgi:uroporphyrin-III C-methyltransferase